MVTTQHTETYESKVVLWKKIFGRRLIEIEGDCMTSTKHSN